MPATIKYLLVSLLFLGVKGYAQNENNKWFFGNLAGLDFMTNPPTVITTGALSTSEGCASIANSAGATLFYTDGLTVYNSSNSTMSNGTGLFGNSSTTQAAVVVKKPGSSTLYYVFTLSSTLYYSIVDMSLSSGSGSVTTKNTVVATSCTERLTSVRHCNGIDTWVLTQASTGDFKAFLVTSSGVSALPVTSSLLGNSASGGAVVGYMKLSPNGKRLGMAVANTTASGFELYDFDASTGLVTNRILLASSIPGSAAYGCEFSPDGSKFYGALWSGTKIYQWDLCAGSATAIVASQYTATCTGGSALQLATNGKIYMAHPNTSYMGVIGSPNSLGSACGYVDLGLSISPKTNYYGLPNFITTGFKSPPLPFTFTVSNTYGCQTASYTAPPIAQTSTIINCTASGYSLTGLLWNFGDPASGAANTSTITNPGHAFTTLGTFTTQLILYYSCGGGTDTLKQTVVINQPCISVTSTSISCASLGSATVAATGGVGPYSYTWMPSAQAGSVASGLGPGVYTVTVFDLGNNFTYTASTSFTSSVPFSGVVANSASVTCNGLSTGTASIPLTGGSGNQNYFWTNGSSILTTSVVSGLSAGIHTVTIIDALTSCSLTQFFQINQPPALTLTVAQNTTAACAGTPITFTATSSGGTPGSGPAYTYTWTAGPLTNTYSVSQAVAGYYVYSVNSSDSKGCIATQTISANVIANPVISVPSISICPFTTGTLTASGATTYTWNTSANSNTLSAGPSVTTTYTVSGSSAGCNSAPQTTSIVLLTVPSITITNSSPVCNGQSLTLTGSGGTSYVWSGPALFNSSIQNPTINPVGLSNAGVYNLTVTAGNSCKTVGSTTVVVNPTPTLSALGSTVCTSQTMSLSASSIAGSTYLWSGPQSFTSNLQNITVPSPALSQSGAYTVIVTSASGCTNSAVASASVISPPSLTVALSSNSICAQALSGSPNTVTLTSSGANTYTLSTPSHINNPNPSGPASPLNMLPPYLALGPATATLLGSNGVCTVSTTAIFTIIPNPTVSINSIAPVICAGQTYTYTSAGADSYTWSPASPGNTLYTNGGIAVANPSINSVFSVAGGSLGCNSALQTSYLTVNVLPQVAINPNPAQVCIGSAARLIASGTGTSYSWSPSAWLSSSVGDTVYASPPALQNYNYIVVASLNNCTMSAGVSVSVIPLPVAIITTSTQSVCMNNTIVLQGSGGSTYDWQGPAPGFNVYGQTISFKAGGLSYSGIYTLTVSDQNNCKGSATQGITVYSLPQGYFNQDQLSGCVPFCADLKFNVSPASAAITGMNWQLNGQNFSGDNFKYCFSTPGDYKITGTLADANNCENSLTATVSVHPRPEADFSTYPDLPIENVDEVVFTNTSRGDQLKSWSWYFTSNGGYRSNNENTAFLFTEAGTYPVAMMVTNTWGCSDTAVKAITIEPDFYVYIPNAFTPNGDVLNDVFMPVMRGVKTYELSIYDRWGAMIFKSTDPQKGWDGSFKGEPCKLDVYAWKLKATNSKGASKNLSGSVSLIR